ncbi:MAG: response regulator [Proteobacteria bacterium]|nr:response regulator [Pseudomonadota bacterium]
MLTRKKMRFRTKLALLFLSVSLAPVLLLGYLNFHYAHKMMDQQAIDQLISLREDRKAQLQAFFKHLRLDMKMLSDHRLLKDILSEYIAAYNKGDLDGEEFKAVDKRCHERCVEIGKEYGYEDMLLVNNDGDVLITVKKGTDWDTNLISGIYSDTNLAKCFKNAKNGISLVDFKEYPPLGRPAAFIGAPMIRHEERRGFKPKERIGVLIIRIPVNQINAIMMRKDGLGDTGETCLIGKDFFMRSDSRFLKESPILKVKAETAAVREAIERRSGYKEDAIDYRGEPVEIAYGPAGIEGLDWAVVAKKDHKEILKPMLALRNQSLMIALLVAIGVVLADFLFVTAIRKPIKMIRDAADKIAGNDLAVRVPVENAGEIGRLALSLNQMAQSLMESRAKIEEYSRSLEKKVEIRTAALKKKTQRLEEGNNTQKAHNEIVAALNTELEIEPLLKSIIGKIAGHTDSQLGVIYLYEEESKTLRPGSTYTVDRELLKDGFRLGHGLPGQSALERREILVTDVPENYFRISSGGLEGAPKNVICVPITIKDQLVGVLELASIHDYTDKSLKFLNIVAYQLGIGINNALTYLRLEKMAEDLKEKNELMAAQNEELQAQNEELQAQSEEIQAQSEEIQAQSEEIQAQSEELISQKKDIEEKSERVKEANRLKSEFLSNMSHELRTPLNSMLGLTNLMAEGIAGRINEKQKEYIEIIERNGKNLLQLINDILDLSKIESGKVDLSISKIEFKRFARSVSSSIMPLIEKKGLSLAIDADDDIFIYCDTDKLRQILVNLIGNAAKFTEKGKISISATVEKGELHDRVIIKVSDTGIGIPADAIEYIFKPFRQADGSLTREYGGTGLGLNICYNLTKLMGGKIEVEGEEGKGSTFTVTLLKDRRSKLRPKEEDWKKKIKEVLVHETLVHETGKELPAPGGKDGKILIIDDDPIIIKEMEIICKKENYYLTSALSGSEGLLLLNWYVPDLILLDLRMPEMDGFKVLEELQKREDLNDLPVMILTAADLTEDEKKGLGKNVKGVIIKGQMDKNALLSMINKILYGGTEAGRATGRQTTKEKEKKPEKNKSEKSKLEKIGLEKIGPAKILIAEDRDDNLILLKEILRPTGYKIYVAKNGQEAVNIAGKERPDLILMDMQMPVMDGFEATKYIRKTKEMKDIPIIGLTARAMKGDKEKVLAAGCSDYLSKPVTMNDLLSKVEEWLG